MNELRRFRVASPSLVMGDDSAHGQTGRPPIRAPMMRSFNSVLRPQTERPFHPRPFGIEAFPGRAAIRHSALGIAGAMIIQGDGFSAFGAGSRTGRRFSLTQGTGIHGDAFPASAQGNQRLAICTHRLRLFADQLDARRFCRRTHPGRGDGAMGGKHRNGLAVSSKRPEGIRIKRGVALTHFL